MTLPALGVQQQDPITVIHAQLIIMNTLEFVKLAVLISIMETTPHKFAKVVTVPVIIVMVVVVVDVHHVLQPNI